MKRRTLQELYHIMAGDVEKILEVFVASAEQGPDGAGALVDVAGLPLTSIVTQERAVQTRVRVLHQFHLPVQTSFNKILHTQNQTQTHTQSHTLPQ